LLNLRLTANFPPPRPWSSPPLRQAPLDPVRLELVYFWAGDPESVAWTLVCRWVIPRIHWSTCGSISPDTAALSWYLEEAFKHVDRVDQFKKHSRCQEPRPACLAEIQPLRASMPISQAQSSAANKRSYPDSRVWNSSSVPCDSGSRSSCQA